MEDAHRSPGAIVSFATSARGSNSNIARRRDRHHTPAARRSDERGTITLWVLGLCVAVMFLGGIGLDLWRAIAVRRELSAMADAAATAAANGVDEAALRAGTVHLDDARARELAYQSLATTPRAASLDAQQVDVADDRVTVVLRDDVPFSLLRIFMGGDPFVVRVQATAEPRVVP